MLLPLGGLLWLLLLWLLLWRLLWLLLWLLLLLLLWPLQAVNRRPQVDCAYAS